MNATPKLGSPEFLARIKELGPWWFQFEKDGHRFGGEVQRDTDKVQLFFDEARKAGVSIFRILEFGSHEGNHTLQLAARPEISEVVGVEADRGNLARAEFVKQLYDVRNVKFLEGNVEHFEPKDLGRFDAVFCAGLLYHLPSPWKLVEKMAKVAPVLFLDTHYVPVAEAVRHGYSGSWLSEASGPLSGVSPRSFVFTLTDTFRVLWEHGYEVLRLRDFAECGPIPGWSRIYLFAIRRDVSIRRLDHRYFAAGNSGRSWSDRLKRLLQ